MDRHDIISQLITFLPNIEAKFQEKNRNTLELWRNDDTVARDVGFLLVSWSRIYFEKLDENQRAALLAAIVWLVKFAQTNPNVVECPLILAVSNIPSALPWNEETFTANVGQAFTNAATNLQGKEMGLVRSSVSRLLSSDGLPTSVLDALRLVDEKSKAPIKSSLPQKNIPRTSGSPFRIQTAIPQQSREIIEAACKALEFFQGVLLNSREKVSNERSIAQARRNLGTDPGSNIEFISYLVFSNLDKKIDGDPFRILPIDVTPLYTLACFLESRQLPNSPIAQGAAPLIFWFKMVVDIDNNNASPSAIVNRMRTKSRTGVLGRFDDAKRDFCRFGNRYLTMLAQRKDLDANIMVEWLEAYRQIALKEQNVLDPALSELLAAAVVVAREYVADARVGTLVDLLDPAKAKHPWTLPAVFPVFSSQECETLLASMRAMQVPEVQQFLTKSDVVKRLKEQLVSMLACDEHSRYKSPAGVDANKQLADARREYERRVGDKRIGYHEACELYAYLLAQSGDVGMAQPLWMEIAKDVRTHEERWNLAVFNLTVGDPRAAFEELWGKIRLGDAPYEHLRFAAYLALAIESDPEGRGVPVLEVLRLLPIAAAHAYAYAITPPEPRAAPPILRDIRSLADDPFESKLRIYRNPRASKRETREECEKEIESIQQSLLALKLKTTWRLWLTGYLNQYPRSRVLWEKLYETWNNDDPKIGREKLDRALEYLGFADSYNECFELMFFLRSYIQRLKPEELDQKRAYLQSVARSSYRFLKEQDARTFEKIWPVTQEPAVASHDPWTAMEPLLLRNFDEPSLSRLVNAGFAQLKQLAPDVRSIDHWKNTYEQLLGIIKSVRLGNAMPEDVASLNNWLVINPANLCEGLLAKVRPLAEWIHKTFIEQVKDHKLAPLPQLEHFTADPGIPFNTSECSAVVDLSASNGAIFKDVRLNVSRSDAVQRKGEPCILPRLAGGITVSISTNFPLSPAHSDTNPLLIRFSGTYTWGIVRALPIERDLQYARFDFSTYLGEFGLKQDMLPGNIFMFDRPIEIAEITQAFVGREQEIAFARSVFSEPEKLPGTPIYIHGIRKVGKTSLLHRFQVSDVLSPDLYLPIYVSLFGLTKETPLAGQCVRIRREIINTLETTGVALETDAPAIVEGDGYKVLESWEQFMSWVRRVAAPRQPVLLLDEFHNLCVPQAAPLLDLIRSIYQRRQILFILAGWVDHEVLRVSCPSSQLFPLEQRSISFLSEAEVSRLVEDQLGRYGVKAGRGVLAHLMRLTEGHPNLVQRICGLVVDELNKYRRPVVTVTDIDRPAVKIVEDGSQFTNSQLNSWVVSSDERKAVNEIIGLIAEEGAWLSLDRLPPDIRSSHIFPLIKKEVLTRDPTSGQIRIRGLLFERYLRSIHGITPDVEAPDKPNVAFVLDYENIVEVCPVGANPADIAQALRRYIEQLGNPKVCIIAANWAANPKSVQVKNAFTAHKFVIMDSYRNDDKTRIRRKGGDKNLADHVIYREIYNRLMEERENANDTIDIYAVASGDGGFKDVIMDLVQKHRKKVHLLARIEHPHLSSEYFPYEKIRKQVAQMPGEDPIPSFIIDDLTPLISHMGVLPVD